MARQPASQTPSPPPSCRPPYNKQNEINTSNAVSFVQIRSNRVAPASQNRNSTELPEVTNFTEECVSKVEVIGSTADIDDDLFSIRKLPVGRDDTSNKVITSKYL